MEPHQITITKLRQALDRNENKSTYMGITFEKSYLQNNNFVTLELSFIGNTRCKNGVLIDMIEDIELKRKYSKTQNIIYI
jgi:hypothetical protein